MDIRKQFAAKALAFLVSAMSLFSLGASAAYAETVDYVSLEQKSEKEAGNEQAYTISISGKTNDVPLSASPELVTLVAGANDIDTREAMVLALQRMTKGKKASNTYINIIAAREAGEAISLTEAAKNSEGAFIPLLNQAGEKGLHVALADALQCDPQTFELLSVEEKAQEEEAQATASEATPAEEAKETNREGKRASRKWHSSKKRTNAKRVDIQPDTRTISLAGAMKMTYHDLAAKMAAIRKEGTSLSTSNKVLILADQPDTANASTQSWAVALKAPNDVQVLPCIANADEIKMEDKAVSGLQAKIGVLEWNGQQPNWETAYFDANADADMVNRVSLSVHALNGEGWKELAQLDSVNEWENASDLYRSLADRKTFAETTYYAFGNKMAAVRSYMDRFLMEESQAVLPTIVIKMQIPAEYQIKASVTPRIAFKNATWNESASYEQVSQEELIWTMKNIPAGESFEMTHAIELKPAYQSDGKTHSPKHLFSVSNGQQTSEEKMSFYPLDTPDEILDENEIFDAYGEEAEDEVMAYNMDVALDEALPEENVQSVAVQVTVPANAAGVPATGIEHLLPVYICIGLGVIGLIVVIRKKRSQG